MNRVRADRVKTEKDLAEATSLLEALRSRNLMDWAVMTYPGTSLLKAYDDEGRNIVFMPVQTCFVPESLGINQEASALQVAKGLEKLFDLLEYEAKKAGMGEMYFLCRDEQTVKFAEHNGMERVGIPVFRMRVK